MGIVYVLKLEAGRWSCGYTENLERRTAEHFLGRGAAWTRLWKPLSLYSAVEGDAELENAQTVALMAQYGWRKVRGGRYTSPALRSQPKVLSSVLGRAVPVRDPKHAFVDELVVGEAKVRFYRSLDGYTASVEGVIFEGSTFGEVIGMVEESMGIFAGRDKETATFGLADGTSEADGVRADSSDGPRVGRGACVDGPGAFADGRGSDHGADHGACIAPYGQNAVPKVRAAASDPDPGRETYLRQEASGAMENESREAVGQAAGCG